MADNPQLEDGYTRIANEIIEQLSKLQLSGYEWRVLMVIWRKTYGWKKKTDMIALSQFEEMTGLPKKKCSQCLIRLSKRNIITKKVPKIGDRNIITYGFNKHFSGWERVPKIGDSPQKRRQGVPKNGDRVSPKTGTTKERKKLIQKKYYVATSDEVRLSEFLLSRILENYPKFKQPNDIQKWAKVMDLTQRIDGRSFEDLKETIEWLYGANLQNNGFQFMVQSPESLRKKFDAIQVQMNKKKLPPKDDREFLGSLKSMKEFIDENEEDSGKRKLHHTLIEPIAGLLEPFTIDV